MTDETTSNDPLIPPEFSIRYMVKHGDGKLKHEHVAYRIFLLDPSDGSVSFVGNNQSLDWKSERNAKERAEWINAHPNMFGKQENEVAVVRKCKVTVEEL